MRRQAASAALFFLARVAARSHVFFFPSPHLFVKLGLRAQLAAIILDDVVGRPFQGLGNVHVVDDVGLDAVAPALDLGVG